MRMIFAGLRRLLAYHSLARVGQSFEKKNYTTANGPKAAFRGGHGHRPGQDDSSPRRSRRRKCKGGISSQGDFTAQCKYAFDKIKALWKRTGATFAMSSKWSAT